MLLKWKRNSANKAELYVQEGGEWKHYRRAQFYVPDATLSTHSGFHTAQKYLKLGYTYKQGIEENDRA